MLPTRYTFSKDERLTNKLLLKRLFSEGASFVIPPFRVIYLKDKELPFKAATQLAISVPKKKLRRAPERNRIKRLTRESWRHQKPYLSSSLTENNERLAVFFIYLDYQLVPYSVVDKSIEKIIQRITGNGASKKNS